MDNKTKSRKELAQENFLAGYNCAQSIVLAFSDVTGLEEEQLSKIACSFGGGMGRLREVCGALSGVFMVAGLLYGYSGPEEGEVKAEQYRKIQELGNRFREKNGSMICRDLLRLGEGASDHVPSERTKEYYEERPCLKIVGNAAEILEEYIREQEITLIGEAKEKNR